MTLACDRPERSAAAAMSFSSAGDLRTRSAWTFRSRDSAWLLARAAASMRCGGSLLANGDVDGGGENSFRRDDRRLGPGMYGWLEGLGDGDGGKEAYTVVALLRYPGRSWDSWWLAYASSAPNVDTAPSTPQTSPCHSSSCADRGGTNSVYVYPLGEEGLDTAVSCSTSTHPTPPSPRAR